MARWYGRYLTRQETGRTRLVSGGRMQKANKNSSVSAAIPETIQKNFLRVSGSSEQFALTFAFSLFLFWSALSEPWKIGTIDGSIRLCDNKKRNMECIVSANIELIYWKIRKWANKHRINRIYSYFWRRERRMIKEGRRETNDLHEQLIGWICSCFVDGTYPTLPSRFGWSMDQYFSITGIFTWNYLEDSPVNRCSRICTNWMKVFLFYLIYISA